VKPPVGCETALLPRRHREDGRGEKAGPGCRVEQPVRERVRLQPGDGRCRVAVDVTQHVVPLENLVQHDAVHESTEAHAIEQTERLAGRPGTIQRRRCGLLSHGCRVPDPGRLDQRL
jgi:hypothetical protein